MCFSSAKRLCQLPRLAQSLSSKSVKTQPSVSLSTKPFRNDGILPPWMTMGNMASTSYSPSFPYGTVPNVPYGMIPYNPYGMVPHNLPHLPTVPIGAFGMESYGVTPPYHPRSGEFPWFGLAGPWAEGASVSSPSWSWSGDIKSGGGSHLMMTRADVTMLLLCAKKQIGISFKDISKAIKKNEVFATAAILGQQSLKKEEAETICELLNLDKKLKPKIVSLLTEPPLRGLPFEHTINGVPTDPTIYRWFEMMQVYGTTFKALVNEKFGSDGVMSSVDMTMDIDKDRNDHVKVTITAPFVPFHSDNKV